MFSHRVGGALRLVPTTIALLLAVCLATPALAQPSLGFRQDWPGAGDLHGWTGGADYSNPGTGGIFGAGDGYLTVGRQFAAQLGTTCMCPEFHGDWQAAGITRVQLWLDDVNGADPLEVHFAIGNGLNFWQYNTGFVPPNDQWAQYTVDLTSAANFTQIIGSGTFADALQNVDRLLIRHDLAPYVQSPDGLEGDFAIDGLELTNALADVPIAAPAPARPVELAPPYPNPSRGPVTLVFQAPDASPVRLEVVDVTGRSVRRVELAAAGGGQRVWLWDGRDDSGRPVAPGAYRVRAVGPGGGTSRPLVRIR